MTTLATEEDGATRPLQKLSEDALSPFFDAAAAADTTPLERHHGILGP